MCRGPALLLGGGTMAFGLSGVRPTYPYLLLSQGRICPLNEGHTRPDTVGPPESQSNDRGPQHNSRKHGVPVLWDHQSLASLYSLGFCVSQHQAAKVSAPSPPTTRHSPSPQQGQDPWLGQKRGHDLARRPRGHTLPRYRKKELLVNAFKCFWGQ